MNIYKKGSLLLIVIFLSSFSIFAQEVCNDGVDNDGDGLVDINDPDCACSGVSISPSSLIPNPSFEDYTTCPDAASQLDYADTWIQASTATSDYFNTCGFTSIAPLPFPDGNAGTGFIVAQYDDGSNYFEYLGAALTSPLLAGNEYQLQFDMAFRWMNDDGTAPAPMPANPTCPIDITIYGTPNAGDIPWATDECPIGVGGFVELGHISYNPDAFVDWGSVSITFTPAFDVYAVVIGGPCAVPVGCGYDNIDPGFPPFIPADPFPYFFADNLILNESASFTAQLGLSGDLCTNDLLLTATSTGSGTYQWYYEGVAMLGETNQSLDVSAISGNAGNYQVTYSELGSCVVQDTLVTYNPVTINVSNDASICQGENVNISASGGASYAWDNGLPAQAAHVVAPLNTTTYHVTTTNTSGCTDTEDILITVNPSPTIPIITGDTILCAGESSVIDAGPGYTTYLWNPSGGNTQSITVNSSNLYTVTVTNAAGCSVSKQVNVSVLANPSPTITGDNLICPGMTSIMDAGAGYSSYLWSNSGTNQTTDIGIQGMLYVTVTDANSCSGEDSINISFSPQIVPNVTASSQFVCVGDDIQLSATGAGAGGSYEWDNGLGVGQIQNATINASADYYVTLTDFNNCTEIASVAITAIDVPNLIVNPQNTTICKGNSVNISVSGASTYSWYPSSGLSTTTGSVVIATPASTISYTITGENEQGGTTCTSTIQSDVIVDDFDFTLPMNKTVCKNTEVDIIANVTGGVAPYSFNWTVNNVLSLETSTVLTDIVDLTKVYQLVGSDGNGCVITKSTTYQNYPDLVMNAYVNVDTVCPGDPVLFNASISGGTGEPYEFVFDEHYSNTILTIYPNETYDYVIVARDACEEIIDTIPIYTFPIPYIDFIADEYSGCQPKEIKFSPMASPSNLIDKYIWNFGDNNNLSNSPSLSHVYTNQGTYDVKLEIKTINGCFADTTKEDLIHIEAKPNLAFTPMPNIVSILKPIILFKNQSENLDSLSYIWDFGSGDLSNVQSPEYTFNTVGNYEVVLIGTTTYGCSDTVYKFIEVKPEIEFYIPTAFTPDGDYHNEVFIPSGTNIIKQGYKFTVYDRWGEPIFETDNLLEGWDGKFNGGSYVKPGIYVYLIVFKDIYGISYEKSGTINLIR